jgi:hypothetical protein
VLTLTLSLALTTAEQDILASVLARRVAQALPASAASDQTTSAGPKPSLLGLYWSSAKAVVRGPAGIVASTNASMFGDNRASFSVRLTSEQAKAANKGLRLEAAYETTLGTSGAPMRFEGSIDLGTAEFRDRISQTEI